MDALTDFEFKQRKYMPVFPKAIGKPPSCVRPRRFFLKKHLTFLAKCGLIDVSRWKPAYEALPLGNVLVSSHFVGDKIVICEIHEKAKTKAKTFAPRIQVSTARTSEKQTLGEYA